MYTNGKRPGTVAFTLRSPDTADEVLIAGSFNQWQPVPMRRRADGSFALTLRLPRGTHEYKFVVDGQWITDPDNDWYATNPYGTANSVAEAA